MLCRPKLSARGRRIRRTVYISVAAILLISVFLEFAVKSQLSDVVAAEMKTLSQRAVNTAVQEYLTENPDAGESLTAVRRNDSGAVTCVTVDPAAVNRLKAAVSESAQDHIETYAAAEGISVPAGSFSGFVLLTNIGPEIHLDIGSRATVSCSLKSTFDSAGVNQTIHHIILTVDVSMVVYSPFRMRRPICASADFEIAQTVIVGAVPNYASGVLWQ